MTKGQLLNKALVIMVKAHDGQFDKGGNPYALHPLEVMRLLKTTDEELQCIALLHDSIEDNKEITFDMLTAEGMTPRIIAAVRTLTKMPGQTYEEYKVGVLENPDARAVKAADLTHNSDIRRLKGIRDKDIARVAEYQRFYMEIKQADMLDAGGKVFQ